MNQDGNSPICLPQIDAYKFSMVILLPLVFKVLAGLLMVIPSLPKSTVLILETLYGLISSTKIVKELMIKGLLVCLC